MSGSAYAEGADRRYRGPHRAGMSPVNNDTAGSSQRPSSTWLQRCQPIAEHGAAASTLLRAMRSYG
jgi:hypothetical protein